MKKIFVVLVALLLCLAFIGCSKKDDAASGAASTNAGPEPIVIGSLNGITQQRDLNNLSMVRGMEVAIEEINAAGGINGRPLVLNNFDTGNNDVQASINGYNYLCDQANAVVVLGPPVSNIGLALMDMAQEKKVPLIGQWILSDITLDPATGAPVPYMYLGQPTANAMAVLAIEYMVNVKGCQKLALIYDQTSAFTVSQVDVFKAYAEEHNIAIVSEQPYIADTTDLRTHLTAIRNSGADGIYATGNAATNTIYLNTLDQLGMSDIVTMGDVNYAPPFLATFPDPSIIKNVYFPLNIDLNDEHLIEVADIYLNKYSDVPERNQINVKYYLSYDMTYMCAAAIKQVLDAGKPLTGETVNEALENSSIIGLTGPLAFSKDTHQVSGSEVSMYIYSINGEYKSEGLHTTQL